MPRALNPVKRKTRRSIRILHQRNKNRRVYNLEKTKLVYFPITPICREQTHTFAGSKRHKIMHYVVEGNCVYSKEQRVCWFKIKIRRQQLKAPQKAPCIRLKLTGGNLGNCKALADKIRKGKFYP